MPLRELNASGVNKVSLTCASEINPSSHCFVLASQLLTMG